MAFYLLQGNEQIHLRLENAVLTPTEAEIHLDIQLPTGEQAKSIQGRLLGPKCPFATTIEIAYPIKLMPRSGISGSTINARFIIPEPSLWDSQSPFLYEGWIEVESKSGEKWKIGISHGLRALRLALPGLRWNDRKCIVHASSVQDPSEETLLNLRPTSINALVHDLEEGARELCHLADRFGFHTLFRIEQKPSQEILQLGEHVAFLGWILAESAWQDKEILQAWLDATRDTQQMLAMECLQDLPTDIPTGVNFLVTAKHYESPPRPYLLKTSAAESLQQDHTGFFGIISQS